MGFDLGELLKDVPKLDTGREQIEYIRLDLIEEDPNNFYQLSDIDALAANIELCGLQQPIRVRLADGGRYRIVSGHRRRKAVEMLAQDNPERWSEIPCIVEADDASPALQQLRLIYANANTRKMTDAEISEQAQQVEKLLYQLKEDGYEFPGRMRDHVAQAVGQSKSKLARLKVIRDNLAAAWRPTWNDGTLSENTAHELAKMPVARQTLLFEEKSRTNANLKYLYADDVKRFSERIDAIVKLRCHKSGDVCGNQENKFRKAAVADRDGWFHCDNKCCKDCPELIRCKAACPKLKDVIQQKKAEAKQVNDAAKAAAEKTNAPAVSKISELWQRFGLAREMAYKDIDACKKALGIYYFPYEEEKVMKLECGEAKISPETKLPFGYSCYLPEISRLIALADLLECSLDWLLCRTDVKEVAKEMPVEPYSGIMNEKTASTRAGWYSSYTEPPVGVKLLLMDAVGFVDEGEYLGGGQWKNFFDSGDPVMFWSFHPTNGEVPIL
jgi:ParB family chromosome partitioning protein